jgi:hypothetical protein
VRGTTRIAVGALATGEVDLADHATPDQFPRTGGALDRADELMPRYPLESQVSPEKLEICVADTGKVHAYERLANSRFWFRVLGHQAEGFLKN